MGETNKSKGDLSFLDGLFNYNKWSTFRKRAFLASALYTTLLCSYAGYDFNKNMQLNKEQGIVVEQKSDKKPSFSELKKRQLERGDGQIIATFQAGRYVMLRPLGIEHLISALHVNETANRVSSEKDFAKLAEYQKSGVRKFTASYPLMFLSFPCTFIHPVNFLGSAAAIYLNWSGESEAIPAEEKIKSIVGKKRDNLKEEIKRLESSLYFKENETQSKYLMAGLLSGMTGLLGLVLLGLGYSAYKSKNKLGKLISVPLLAGGALLELNAAVLPFASPYFLKEEQAQIRYELGRDYRKAGNLEQATLQFRRATELNKGLLQKMDDNEKHLLN